MASSSTASLPKSFQYDVFLSFRGEDTRKTFVDHLYLALLRKNINTFKDDKNMEKGEKITTELIKAIENSRFYIIVFSKNYASSSWCLDELVKIIECQRTAEQNAYPIFYDVEPTEVRKQSGVFGKGFDGRRMDRDAGKWIEALKEAADLSGWELKNIADGHEGQFIQKVVEEISQKIPLVGSNIDGNLVGMGTRTDAIISSLKTCVDDVRMIGIWGIGGGGKTTLARAVFDLISSQFEHKSFLEDVREVSKSNMSGLKKLQKQVLQDVLNQTDVTKFKSGMHHLKVLVVLDDVDDIEQLEALAQKVWFGPGSTIIITTRDEHVLIAHRVKLIHDINKLSDEEALCLFNRFVFGGEIPDPRYNELLQQFVRYAYGHPLTIKVLGLDLIGNDEDYWQETLEKLKTIPPEKVLNRLELSYIGLTEENKRIFLDVACFWKGERKDEAIRALESLQLHPKVGLGDLERKSLITVVKDESHARTGNGVQEIIRMHDRIQDMGREIVRREHPDEPYRRSRLWNNEEIEEILAEETGCEATIGIKFRVKFNKKIHMKGLRKMKNLKFLHLAHETIYSEVDEDTNYKIDEFSHYFPNSLQYLFWENCPFRCLANTFGAKYLVGIEMSLYHSRQLWENGERKVLNKLKFLVLNYSPLTTLNLGVTPNIELLIVKGSHLKEGDCLEELHMPGNYPKLKSVILSDSMLKSFDLEKTPNLERLDMGRFFHLEELHMPGNYPKLKYLNIARSKLKSFDLGKTPNLEILNLNGHDYFEELHIPNECPTLKSIILWVSNIKSFDFRKTPNLKILVLVDHYSGPTSERDDWTIDLLKELNWNTLVFKSIMSNLRKLKSLPLEHAILSRTLDLGRSTDLELLSREGCDEQVDNQVVLEYPYLQSLQLSLSNLKNLNLLMTPHLETLTLNSCDSLVEISFGGVPKLKHLKLFSLNKLETLDLRQCVNLETLVLNDSVLLEYIYLDNSNLTTLQLGTSSLGFISSRGSPSLPKLRTLDISMTPNLESLTLFGCKDSQLKMPFQHPKLKTLTLGCSMLKTLILGIPNLESLDLVHCYDFLKLQILDECRKLKHIHFEGNLRKLSVIGNIPKLPRKLDKLNYLEELILSSTKIEHLPVDFCELRRLRVLKLESCHLFEKLPEDLGQLECLEELIIRDCKSLRGIPDDICILESLKYLCLSQCIAVEKLPEMLGSLEPLIELDIEGTSISHLPQGIVLFKDLRIIGSKLLLQSCEFTSHIQTSDYETFYHGGIHSTSLLYRAATTALDSSTMPYISI